MVAGSDVEVIGVGDEAPHVAYDVSLDDSVLKFRFDDFRANDVEAVASGMLSDIEVIAPSEVGSGNVNSRYTCYPTSSVSDFTPSEVGGYGNATSRFVCYPVSLTSDVEVISPGKDASGANPSVANGNSFRADRLLGSVEVLDSISTDDDDSLRESLDSKPFFEKILSNSVNTIDVKEYNTKVSLPDMAVLEGNINTGTCNINDVNVSNFKGGEVCTNVIDPGGLDLLRNELDIDHSADVKHPNKLFRSHGVDRQLMSGNDIWWQLV